MAGYKKSSPAIPPSSGGAFLSGELNPSNDLGNVGDMYLDTENIVLYGPKSAEAKSKMIYSRAFTYNTRFLTDSEYVSGGAIDPTSGVTLSVTPEDAEGDVYFTTDVKLPFGQNVTIRVFVTKTGDADLIVSLGDYDAVGQLFLGSEIDTLENTGEDVVATLSNEEEYDYICLTLTGGTVPSTLTIHAIRIYDGDEVDETTTGEGWYSAFTPAVFLATKPVT
jgi:hypothetical protein